MIKFAAMIDKKALDKINQFNKEHPRQTAIFALLKKWDLKKTPFSKIMRMAQSSFINKSDPKQDRFNFNDEELDRITDIIHMLSDDLKANCPPKPKL